MNKRILLNYIADDELDEALAALQKEAERLQRDEVVGTIATLKGRLANYYQKFHGGIASHGDLTIERNQIGNAIKAIILEFYNPVVTPTPPFYKKRWAAPIFVLSLSVLIILVGQLPTCSVPFQANIEVSGLRFRTAKNIEFESNIETNDLTIQPLTHLEWDGHNFDANQLDVSGLRLEITGGIIVLDHFFNTEDVEVTCEYASRLLKLSKFEKMPTKGIISAENSEIYVKTLDGDLLEKIQLEGAASTINWKTERPDIAISFEMTTDSFILFKRELIEEIKFCIPEEDTIEYNILKGDITIDDQSYFLEEKDILKLEKLKHTTLSVQQYEDVLKLTLKGWTGKVEKQYETSESLMPTLLEHYVSQYQNSVVITSFLYLIGLLYTLWKAWKDDK